MPSPQILLIKELRSRIAAGIMDCKRALLQADGDVDAAIKLLQARRIAPVRPRLAVPEGVVACALTGRKGVLVEVSCETDFVARNPRFVEAAAGVARAALDVAGDRERTLASPSPDGNGDVSELLARLAAEFGEDIFLRRLSSLNTRDGILGVYVHNKATPNVGRAAAIVAVSGGDDDALAVMAPKLAMHVVGATPLWTSVEDVPAAVKDQKRGSPRKGPGGVDLEFGEIDRMIEARLDRFYELTVLLRQPHVVDRSMSVADMIRRFTGAQTLVEGFVRLRVGEDAAHDAAVAQATELEWTFGNDWSAETPARVFDVGEIRVFQVSPNGPRLRDDRDTVDLINAAWSHHAPFIAIPVERLPTDFFPLSTRRAGTILQKFSNLGARLAIVGDLSAKTAESTALRDFIFETNQRDHVWFVRDMGVLTARLTSASASMRAGPSSAGLTGSTIDRRNSD